MNPRKVPWRLALKTLRILRTTVFRRKKHDIYLHADASLEEVRTALGNAHFTNQWEFSYFQGENLNMRRPLRKDDDYEWYQTHARGYKRKDGTVGLSCHTELEPSEHPKGHLKAINYDLNEGTEKVRQVLEDAGITVTDIRTEEAKQANQSKNDQTDQQKNGQTEDDGTSQDSANTQQDDTENRPVQN